MLINLNANHFNISISISLPLFLRVLVMTAITISEHIKQAGVLKVYITTKTDQSAQHTPSSSVNIGSKVWCKWLFNAGIQCSLLF